MKITIDYIQNLECVNIYHDGTNAGDWEMFRKFIHEIIPVELVVGGYQSVSFPWRFFISITNNINTYLSIHDSIFVEITQPARAMLEQSSASSYEKAIQLQKQTKDEIKFQLEKKGFIRALKDHQYNNLCKISVLPSAATFSVPGAGKTTEALAYFCLNSEESDKLLVVAPKNAFSTWEEQIEECFSRETGYKFTRLRGGEAGVSGALARSPKFMIITYEQLPLVKSEIISMFEKNSCFLFLDESHRIKGGNGKVRADTILDIAYLPKKKLIMSGTPMPQSSKDLVPQFSFLYPTKKVDENNVISIIQPIYVRTTKNQLGIPEVERHTVKVKMSPLQRSIYDELKSEMCRQLNYSLSDKSRIELRHIGKCIMKVLEFVSNPALLASDMDYVYNEKIGQFLRASNGPKIDYVIKRARELANNGEKVIIWSCFVKNVELIALRLEDLGAEYIHGGIDAGDENATDTREGKIKRFHDDNECKVLVANPAACSEGISLHKVCHHAIYLDRNFNAAHFLQSEDRIHRLGLPEGVHPCVEIVECEESVDQLVADRLKKKINAMATALNDEALKAVAEDYIDYIFDEESYDDISYINNEDEKEILKFFFPGAMYD